MNIIRENFRKRSVASVSEPGTTYKRRELGLGELAQDEMNEETVPEMQAEEQDTMAQAVRGPMRDTLLAALETCLGNPRQAQVIVELFLNDKSFAQVAQELGTTPLNVQVMKSRAMTKLRDCADFEQLYRDWLEQA